MTELILTSPQEGEGWLDELMTEKTIEQLHYSLIFLTALGFIPFLNYWNLLGFRYRSRFISKASSC